MASDTLPFRLSDHQVQHFKDEGYLIIEHLFDDAELQPVIDEISADLDQRCRKAVAEGKLSRTYEECGFEHRLTHVNRENPNIAKSMRSMKLVLSSFFGLMINPKLLDVAEQLCGPEVIASSVYRLRPKVPSHSWSPVPWHQDSGYFEPYCDYGLILTVWLPLVDATEERGCLWVITARTQGRTLLAQARRYGALSGNSRRGTRRSAAHPCPGPQGRCPAPHQSHASRQFRE